MEVHDVGKRIRDISDCEYCTYPEKVVCIRENQSVSLGFIIQFCDSIH